MGEKDCDGGKRDDHLSARVINASVRECVCTCIRVYAVNHKSILKEQLI